MTSCASVECEGNLGAVECDSVHTLPYGKFNGDISVWLIYLRLASINMVYAEKLNEQGIFNLTVNCVSAIRHSRWYLRRGYVHRGTD